MDTMTSNITEESTVVKVANMEQETNNEKKSPPAAPNDGLSGGRKRPRIDLTTDSRQYKRGKSMFGILLGTLNKAKQEDHDRSLSDAARKRADIDRRLHAQLAEEHDSVRRAEELKRDRQTASRKEEDLKLKDSIFRLRRTRLPTLSHFLLTSDKIPQEDDDSMETSDPLALPPRSHPPPLYYLPAVLLPSQAKFLEKRNTETKGASEKEWESWETQRNEGYEDVKKLQAKVEEEDKRIDTEKPSDDHDGSDGDTRMDDVGRRRRSDKDTEEEVKDADADAAMPVEGDDDVEY